MLHLDLVFPSCVNGFFLSNNAVHASVLTLQTHQILVPTLLCTLCHEFGGLTVPEFLFLKRMRLYLLDILHMVFTLESGHAVDAANSMLALR
jgi:hypothetical protein